MKLSVIAARIAGKALLLMKDMGYDPAKLVDDKMNNLDDKGIKRADATLSVNNAILRAWKKAGLPDPKIDNLQAHPDFIVHELEHKILDPDFDLETGKSGSHSKTESVIEEALSWGLRGAKDWKILQQEVIGASEGYLTKYDTVGDAIDGIASAKISSPTRKKIRDVAVRKLKQDFAQFLDSDINELVGGDNKWGANKNRYLGYVLTDRFLKHIVAQYDDWKDILTEEHEEGWKRFNLNLKNEIQKLSK